MSEKMKLKEIMIREANSDLFQLTPNPCIDHEFDKVVFNSLAEGGKITVINPPENGWTYDVLLNLDVPNSNWAVVHMGNYPDKYNHDCSHQLENNNYTTIADTEL